MKTQELFYPEISVSLGNYVLDAGIEIQVYSDRNSYFDFATVKFTKQYAPALSVSKKDKTAISLGYNGFFDSVFEGYVSGDYSANVGDEIQMKDEMLLLEETEVNNTFLDATPQEMIEYFLSQAGVQKMKLTSQFYPAKARVPIRKMSALQAIHQVHSIWGIQLNFFFSDGTFYWGEEPEQKKVYKFQYGVNILRLTRMDGSWELETVSAPFVKHSHVIQVEHPDFTGTAKVSKVVFSTNDAGFIRTHIYF